MKKKLLKYIDTLESQSFVHWTRDQVEGYKTALSSIKEKVKELGKPDYEYNVRRIYNSIDGIYEFNKEMSAEGWEITGTHRINESSSYIIFTLRREKL